MRMKESSTGPLYDLWSRGYDRSFGTLVRKRQRRAVAELRAKPGQRVLDLGIGTGMTIDHYPQGVEVVGVDLSRGMLSKARAKLQSGEHPHVRLVQGDALAPPFAERSFDHILITHVVSVVSDPRPVMAWATRLLRPGGRIVILNHFQSAHRPLALLERLFNPLFVKIGWRSDLALAELLEDCAMRLDYQFKLAAMDLWRIVVLSDQRGEQREDERKDAEPERITAAPSSSRSV